jgi:hypothetical protein
MFRCLFHCVIDRDAAYNCQTNFFKRGVEDGSIAGTAGVTRTELSGLGCEYRREFCNIAYVYVLTLSGTYLANWLDHMCIP